MASPTVVPFELFGGAHGVTLAVVGILAVAAYRTGLLANQSGKARVVAVVLASVLISVEIVKPLVFVYVYDIPWSENLPLHLCRLSMLLCAYTLMLHSYRVFEVAYFWVIGGSVPALLMPDVSYGFPHPLYLLFFIGHALAIIGMLFAVAGYGFRPRLRSIGITAVVSALYMLVVIPVNGWLDTNYLYLREKPAGASLYDYLGPWPWYVLGIWVTGLLVCLVCYAPFAFTRRARSDAPRDESRDSP